jgi:chemotaxis protein MotB
VPRRRRREERASHDAWAIPYADLITLLLAFFVVMYATSSVNTGKYRVLSESLSVAFQGKPDGRVRPSPTGRAMPPSGAVTTPIPSMPIPGTPKPAEPGVEAVKPLAPVQPDPTTGPMSRADLARLQRQAIQLGMIAHDVETAMAVLVMQDQVVVRNHGDYVEVEIRNDILFGSGSATLSPTAEAVIAELAGALRDVPNPIRVEGHTDDVPIRSVAFPSNWELSAARAASVVRILASRGVAPQRLAVLGMGEFHPKAANDNADGRNANRRVLLMILRDSAAAEASP